MGFVVSRLFSSNADLDLTSLTSSILIESSVSMQQIYSTNIVLTE